MFCVSLHEKKITKGTTQYYGSVSEGILITHGRILQDSEIKNWLIDNIEKKNYSRSTIYGRESTDGESLYLINFKLSADVNLFKLLFSEKYKIEVYER